MHRARIVKFFQFQLCPARIVKFFQFQLCPFIIEFFVKL
jgi:hypothetical protein